MKHISEILPKALYKITGIEREYLLNYIKDMETEMKVLREENMFLKGHCCKCGTNLGKVRSNKKYCSSCSAEVKVEAQRKFSKKVTEVVDAACIDCDCPTKAIRAHVKHSRCAPCKQIFMKRSHEAYRTSLGKKVLDPLGDKLISNGGRFDV